MNSLREIKVEQLKCIFGMMTINNIELVKTCLYFGPTNLNIYYSFFWGEIDRLDETFMQQNESYRITTLRILSNKFIVGSYGLFPCNLHVKFPWYGQIKEEKFTCESPMSLASIQIRIH